MPHDRMALMAPLDDAVDHVRGSSAGRLIMKYGDYECPYSRQSLRAIERVETRLGEGVRFAYRHLPLTEIVVVECPLTVKRQLVHGPELALQGGSLRGGGSSSSSSSSSKAVRVDLRRYVAEFGLDLAEFDHDRTGARVLERVRRDVDSGPASGQVRGTPTLFVDGIVHRGAYDEMTLLEALTT